jgi:hypothetical protein
MFSPMFELTRREQSLLAGFLFILVLGLGARHWRDSRALGLPAAEVPEAN